MGKLSPCVFPRTALNNTWQSYLYPKPCSDFVSDEIFPLAQDELSLARQLQYRYSIYRSPLLNYITGINLSSV